MRDVAVFYAIAFGFSWAFWVPQALDAQGLVSLPGPIRALVEGGGNPAAWGPFVAALAVTAWRGGRAGVGTLLRRVVAVRFAPRWYALILLSFPVLLGIPLAIAALSGEAIPESMAVRMAGDAPLSLYLVVAFGAILLLGGPLQEELGWRGVALDPLRARLGELGASVVVGLGWGLWHLPLFWVPREEIYYNRPIWGLMLTLVLISVLFTWIHQRTDRSLFAAILLHTVFNWTNVALPTFDTDVGGLVAFALLGVTALAIALAWRR